MTSVAYALGTPRPAGSRGGDCRARDLGQDINVHGPHRFASTGDCQITNGMLRLTLGAIGAAPVLTVAAWRGRMVVGDAYDDTYDDTYSGVISTPEWLSLGVITIDSPSGAAVLTGVQLAKVTPEIVTLRLVAPAINDAFVVLRRGERQCRIQHGSTRPPLADIDRRIRWTDSPVMVGAAAAGRVEEPESGVDGLYRYLGALDTATVDAAAFSLTAASVPSARFGAGVASRSVLDRPLDLHSQLGDASRPRLVVA